MKTELQYRKAIGCALLNTRNAMAEDGIKITQEDIALDANISSRYYGSIERGKVTPSIYTLAKIAEALQMPLHKLCELIENY
ncbi:MAG: helix-turn-helix transcriptional regulator [Bacteroidales bacterium]|nr:helix-turn-helix transcriptional regulator [Bacteroidales bacterium]